ncbi:hypothetical protein CEXT_400621, partial [Caerostris extrusa]
FLSWGIERTLQWTKFAPLCDFISFNEKMATLVIMSISSVAVSYPICKCVYVYNVYIHQVQEPMWNPTPSHGRERKKGAVWKNPDSFQGRSKYASSNLASDMPTMKMPNQCQFCPRYFYTKFDLVRHTYMHTGEKPFAVTSVPSPSRAIKL